MLQELAAQAFYRPFRQLGKGQMASSADWMCSSSTGDGSGPIDGTKIRDFADET